MEFFFAKIVSQIQFVLHTILTVKSSNPPGNYMFKVNNRNTRRRFEICSKLTLKKLERRQWLINFEHVIASWGEMLAVGKCLFQV